MRQELTPKKQLVVETFERLRPGTGELAKRTILNNEFGWREIIKEMTEEEIQLQTLVKGDTNND